LGARSLRAIVRHSWGRESQGKTGYWLDQSAVENSNLWHLWLFVVICGGV
jgi:hypothetical protein